MGKKKRRGKNNSNIEKNFVEPTESQYFARVIKNMGNCKFEIDVCYYFQKDKNSEINTEINYDDQYQFRIDTKIGVVRGNMLRRHWVNAGDIILVTERDFEQSKVDIIAVYPPYHYNKIRNHVLSPPELFNKYGEGEVKFEDNSDESGDELKSKHNINTNFNLDLKIGIGNQDSGRDMDNSNMKFDALGNTIE